VGNFRGIEPLELPKTLKMPQVFTVSCKLEVSLSPQQVEKLDSVDEKAIRDGAIAFRGAMRLRRCDRVSCITLQAAYF
jgi:hypothetical protein